MVILIYGGQYPLISKRCKKVVSSILEDEIDDFSYVKISAKETLVQDIVYECQLMPLGGKKVVQVDYPYFLTSLKDKVEIEKNQDYEALVNYIENDEQEDVCLLFVIEADKLNEKNEVVKALKKNAKIYFEEGLTIDSLRQTAIPYFQRKGCTISQGAIDLLFQRVGDDVTKFIQEAEKLSLYKKDIQEEDVAVMVSVPLEQNAFNIAESLINNHIPYALRTFRDLLTQKQEPVMILNLLASQFRTLNEVSYLYTIEKINQDEIASILKMHPYRVKMTCRNLVKLSFDQLNNIMDYLYNLDCRIKGMEVDPDNGLELFMIDFNDIKNKNLTKR
jgi:DNA polymerase-3 subunit delta